MVTLRAPNPDGRSLFSARETARGQKAVVPLLDKLVVELQEHLWESVEATARTKSRWSR
jgi:hypothetical protein